jgi:hypothetical protein
MSFFGRYKILLVLTSCVILALFLRLHHIIARPFWLDEANAVNLLKIDVWHSWQTIEKVDGNPIYIFMMKLWSYLFSDSELSMRGLSTFFSILSIILIYRLGKVLFNKTVGLWASFLMSINFFSIFFSIQARQYSAIIFFSLLSNLFFINFSKNKEKNYLFFYVLATVIGIYLHPWMFLVVGAQFIWLLMEKREKIFQFIVAGIIILFLIIPRLRELIGFAGAGVNDWITSPTLGTFKETYSYFIYGSEEIYFIFGVIATMAVFFRIKKSEQGGKSSYWVEEKKFSLKNINKSSYFICLSLLFPIIVAWIISQFFPFYVAGRYEAAVLPAFILIFAILFSRFRGQKITAFVILTLIVFSYKSIDDDGKAIASLKVNDKTITRQIINNAKNSDYIIFTDLSRPPFDYYYPRLNIENKKFEIISFPQEMEMHPAFQSIREMMKKENEIKAESKRMIENIKKSMNGENQSIWVFYSAGNRINEILFQDLKDNFSLKESIQLYHSRLFSGEASEVSPLHFQEILRFE